MKLTKAERNKLKQVKKEIEDKKLVSNRPVKTRKKTKRQTPFINVNITTVKAKKQRRKKIKMPSKSLKIFPKTKPQNSWLYKYLVK